MLRILKYHLIACSLLLSCATSESGQNVDEHEQSTIEEQQVYSCENMPEQFANYDELESALDDHDFMISEYQNTSQSSWVRGAQYFSCDGETGYFLLSTDKQNYVHANVPLSVWNGFQAADSYGTFYSHNIKGRFRP